MKVKLSAPTLGKKGYRFLKFAHLIFAALWLGGTLAVFLRVIIGHPQSDGEIRAIYETAKLIDDIILIPGVLGCFVSGLVFSIFTNWGFFKQKWILVKYIINLEDIIFGGAFLGPWVDELAKKASVSGLDVLNNETFLKTEQHLIISMIFQIVLILFVFYISVARPWKKKQ